MRKAQGALEYLIIIAAVLAIAAIVVLFITGAFKSSSGGSSMASCRVAAASCQQNLVTGVYSNNSACLTSCIGACVDSSGKDLLAPTITVDTSTCVVGGTATACARCRVGNASAISGT